MKKIVQRIGGKEFDIDKSYYKYKHKNGHEDAPMVLNARFRPERDASVWLLCTNRLYPRISA